MKRAFVVLAVLAAAGCRRPPPVGMEPVRLYVAPGLPGELAADLARGFEIAMPRLVDRIELAEVAWLPDPAAAIALGARAVPGSAPEQPGVPSAFTDPKRRFAPVGAVAQVIVMRAAPGEPFLPDELRDLADRRVKGRVAVARLGSGGGPALVAALELAYGERGTRGWLEQLAANAPRVVESGAEVIARVSDGRATFGLVDSLSAGSAAGGAGLRVVFPDQKAKGCVVVPTALVVLPGAGAAARKLSAWLAGPTAEAALVHRAIGLLPLRADATAPPGMEPIWRLKALTVDWSVLAGRRAIWERRLAAWPEHPVPLKD